MGHFLMSQIMTLAENQLKYISSVINPCTPDKRAFRQPVPSGVIRYRAWKWLSSESGGRSTIGGSPVADTGRRNSVNNTGQDESMNPQHGITYGHVAENFHRTAGRRQVFPKPQIGRLIQGNTGK